MVQRKVWVETHLATNKGISVCTVPLFLYSDHAEPEENFVTKMNKISYEKKAYQLGTN
jgi:hypothetical protein